MKILLSPYRYIPHPGGNIALSIRSQTLMKVLFRLVLFLFVILTVCLPQRLFAQTNATAEVTNVATSTVPMYWYVLGAAFSMLVPAGFILVSLAGLDAKQAWDTALGGVAALGLAAVGYWAIGFALQFGGIGLIYPITELRGLVWECTPLSSDWGIVWGVAGLSGWFLSGADVTALAYALFLAHLPWAMTASLLPVMAIRGRAPTLVSLLMALLVGALIYPLSGNWVQGGGWLSSLGRNMELGHGTVDFGGAGSIHLVAAGIGLAALSVWSIRGRRSPKSPTELPAAEMPVLAVVGSLLLIGGSIGWQWANPLQVNTLHEAAMMRGAINAVLSAAAGVLIPMIYTWFVSGSSEPMMSARGIAAGAVAGMACGPFVQPGIAFLIGLLAGASVPFVTYLTNAVLRLDDATGIVSICGAPALIGLILTGFFADGVAGQGWQMTGLDSYLGVNGQGVSGLFVTSGFQPDFPGQLQAQLIGLLALGLWGFVTGLIISVPLGLLAQGLQRSSHESSPPSRETSLTLRNRSLQPAPQYSDEPEQEQFIRPPLRDRNNPRSPGL